MGLLNKCLVIIREIEVILIDRVDDDVFERVFAIELALEISVEFRLVGNLVELLSCSKIRIVGAFHIVLLPDFSINFQFDNKAVPNTKYIFAFC